MAEEGGTVVGFALWYVRFSTWTGCRLYLEDIVVTASRRGEGIGQRLFAAVLAEARAREYAGMTWQMLDWNEGARRFYDRYGPRYDGEWVNCHIDLEKSAPVSARTRGDRDWHGPGTSGPRLSSRALSGPPSPAPASGSPPRREGNCGRIGETLLISIRLSQFSWYSMRRLLLALFFALCSIGLSAAYDPDTLTVTILDVGQADAIPVQAPNGASMLVDAAEPWNASVVSACLAEEGIDRLAFAVGTHNHEDHIGGMVHVLPQVTVGQYVNSSVPPDTQWARELNTYIVDRGIPFRSVTAGDTIALDPANVTVTVLNPPADPGTDANEASVVLRLAFGTQSFLLAGDTGTTAEGWMLASNRTLASQFLKAGHHGARPAQGRHSSRLSPL